jgi:hypothetical protein
MKYHPSVRAGVEARTARKSRDAEPAARTVSPESAPGRGHVAVRPAASVMVIEAVLESVAVSHAITRQGLEAFPETDP